MKNIMNKINLILLSALFATMVLTGCSSEVKEPVVVSTKITQPDTVISKPQDQYAYISYSLNEFAGKTVTINFSADMKVTNNKTEAVKLMWQVMHSPYPVVAEYTFEPGVTDFVSVTSADNKEGTNKNISLGNNEVLYLSTNNDSNASEITIELKNVQYTVIYSDDGGYANPLNWLDDSVPSLKETYKDIFDSFGIACEYNNKELQNTTTLKGLSKHANSITTGNEFKPDFIFSWGLNENTATEKFTASNGKTIDVPKTLNGFSRVDSILETCKANGLKMRGHVLVWHSQTPDNFFAEGYSAKTSGDLITNLVDKATMTARQEWYIKTVLEHVADWEAKNNNGQHIIWAWDVVNEAIADDAKANQSGWVRGDTTNTKNKAPGNGGSRWFQVYGSEEFIINAFRFANAYAPADVKLCYNDYNEYMNYNGGYKTDSICTLIDEIKNGAAQTINGKSVKPRIDVMGMQSHVGTQWPGVSGYESALQKYLSKGVDVHVTELDIEATSSDEAKSCYGEYFRMLKKYGKKYSGKNKITNVTVWGINNKDSWISNKAGYPLLFDNFVTTDAFWAVIDAAK